MPVLLSWFRYSALPVLPNTNHHDEMGDAAILRAMNLGPLPSQSRAFMENWKHLTTPNAT